MVFFADIYHGSWISWLASSPGYTLWDLLLSTTLVQYGGGNIPEVKGIVSRNSAQGPMPCFINGFGESKNGRQWAQVVSQRTPGNVPSWYYAYLDIHKSKYTICLSVVVTCFHDGHPSIKMKSSLTSWEMAGWHWSHPFPTDVHPECWICWCTQFFSVVGGNST